MSNIIKQESNVISSKKKKFNKRKIFFVVLIVLLLGIVSGWFYMQNKKAAEDAAVQVTNETIAKVTSDAQILENGGDIDGAAAKYDEAIGSTNDNYQASILLVNKAIVYLNNEDYDKALEISLEAEKKDPNFAVVKIIAQIYEEKGDKANAIKYYQKTIEAIDPSDPMAVDDAEYYQSLIDGLNGANQ